MNRAEEEQRQTWDAAADDATDKSTVGSRRLLLGGIAGGLSLTASGLLLPDRFVDEVEARKGANGGALGGRHGKDHRGSRRRRKRDRKQNDRRDDSSNARGKGLQRNVLFSIYNAQRLPQDVQVWVMGQDTYLNRRWEVKWSDRIEPGQTRQ